MFIWDFVAETVLGQIIDWIYGQIVGFLGDFFMQMGNMGADLFAMSWVQSIVLFFSYLAWALYATGLVVAVFECGIEYQTGRGSVKETALNAIKGFLAVSLFTTVPVELYKLCVSLQGSFTADITGLGDDFGTVAAGIVNSLKDAGTWEQAAASGAFGGLTSITSPVLMIFILILMGYAIIKVFFANLKRGGILLIQIAVGSLYLFSVPRGYIDGFVSWSKQVIGLCLTAFLQATVLVAGLMVVKDQALLGLGLMLSAGEIPRIAGQFGLDTTTRANVMGAVYAAQGAVNLTRTIVQTVAK
ncbi:MAG: conjugal transfer protein TrbL family protein [Monoglobales bacterium]